MIGIHGMESNAAVAVLLKMGPELGFESECISGGLLISYSKLRIWNALDVDTRTSAVIGNCLHICQD
jgi:hypothetical protein